MLQCPSVLLAKRFGGIVRNQHMVGRESEVALLDSALDSVSVDPSIGSGSCAVTAQQYFGGDGQWNTRIGRVGSC
jgi:hypothetical protein